MRSKWWRGRAKGAGSLADPDTAAFRVGPSTTRYASGPPPRDKLGEDLIRSPVPTLVTPASSRGLASFLSRQPAAKRDPGQARGDREGAAFTVIPAKAGISCGSFPAPLPEIPASAGMTVHQTHHMPKLAPPFALQLKPLSSLRLEGRAVSAAHCSPRTGNGSAQPARKHPCLKRPTRNA